mmetsp:Transcript_50472/g.130071  ORF Transcript_50472/g.130071 Transcript_50472/m.130071 type:complete len:201 (-) Transcript_50472:1387-1989(-)
MGEGDILSSRCFFFFRFFLFAFLLPFFLFHLTFIIFISIFGRDLVIRTRFERSHHFHPNDHIANCLDRVELVPICWFACLLLLYSDICVAHNSHKHTEQEKHHEHTVEEEENRSKPNITCAFKELVHHIDVAQHRSQQGDDSSRVRAKCGHVISKYDEKGNSKSEYDNEKEDGKGKDVGSSLSQCEGELVEIGHMCSVLE